jgi:hypothetical protein
MMDLPSHSSLRAAYGATYQIMKIVDAWKKIVKMELNFGIKWLTVDEGKLCILFTLEGVAAEETSKSL